MKQGLNQEQKIIRKVTQIGNGAHIFAPKDWAGEEVMLIRIPRRDVKEEIIKFAYPFLDKIIGIYLFGSYARGEQTEDSDIDVLIISTEKFKIEKRGFEIIVLEESKLEKALKLNPILMYSIISESKPIINSSLLSNLRKLKPSLNIFREFISSTKDEIKLNKEMLKLEEGNYISANSIIYSLILRLRGIFIIHILLKRASYSNEAFKKWIKSEIKDIEYENIYSIYRAIRDNKKETSKATIKDARSLLSLLEREVNTLK